MAKQVKNFLNRTIDLEPSLKEEDEWFAEGLFVAATEWAAQAGPLKGPEDNKAAIALYLELEARQQEAVEAEEDEEYLAMYCQTAE